MRFGLYVGPIGDYADPRTLASLARDAEAAGWDGFFTWDHITMDHVTPVADPWIAFAAIATQTERIRFGPLVTPLTRRRPWKVAREAASLDQLSGGRLILGVGLGYSRKEFRAFNEPFGLKRRAAMLDEALEVLTGLWSGEPFSFAGKHYRVKEAQFLPGPVQSPRVPIWVAGLWPNRAPLRRAARWDGVFPLNRRVREDLSPAQVREIVAYVREHRASDAPFDVVHRGTMPGEDPSQGAEAMGPYAEAGATGGWRTYTRGASRGAMRCESG